jgi:hypothetical protein
VILDCTGAEELGRPGRCLAGLVGGMRLVQSYRIGRERLAEVLAPVASADPARFVVPPADGVALSLGDLDRELVRFAVEELAGAFTINKLVRAFTGRIASADDYIRTRGQEWEQAGLLEAPRDAFSPRKVSESLAGLAGLPVARVGRVAGMDEG